MNLLREIFFILIYASKVTKKPKLCDKSFCRFLNQTIETHSLSLHPDLLLADTQ